MKAITPCVTIGATGDGKSGMRGSGLVEADVVVERTANLLGGQRILHRRVVNGFDAHILIREGLPSKALQHLIEGVGISANHNTSLEKAVGISLRTFQRRKEKPDKPLSAEQSGRAWKFAEVLGRAIEIFGSRENAERWLQTPAMALDQWKPIDLLSTPAGIEMIEDHLGRLEYGVYT